MEMLQDQDYVVFIGEAVMPFFNKSKRVEVHLHPDAGHAELTFQMLASLSLEERKATRFFNIKREVLVEDDHGYVIGKKMVDVSDMDFESCYPDDTRTYPDIDVCPECGCTLSGDLNPMCEHPRGCGAARELKKVSEDEER